MFARQKGVVAPEDGVCGSGRLPGRGVEVGEAIGNIVVADGPPRCRVAGRTGERGSELIVVGRRCCRL